MKTLANQKYVFLTLYIISTDSYMHIKDGILLPGAQAALYHLETPELGIAMTVTVGTHLIFLANVNHTTTNNTV